MLSPALAARRKPRVPPPDSSPDSSPDAVNDIRDGSELSVGAYGYNVNYAEAVAPPGKSTENGILPGARVEYKLHFGEGRWYLRAAGDVALGSTQFNGNVWGTNQTLVTPTNDAISNVELNGGVVLTDPHAPSRLLAYLGIGLHNWNRIITGGNGYPEDYLWLFFPVGLRWENRFGNWSIVVDGSFHWGFAGKISAFLSQNPDLGYNDAFGSLGGISGGRLEVPVTYWLSESWGIGLTPWVEYISVAQGPSFPLVPSDGSAATTTTEPASQAWLVGGYLYGVFHW